MDEDTRALVAVSGVYMLAIIIIMAADFKQGAIAYGVWAGVVVGSIFLYYLMRKLRKK